MKKMLFIILVAFTLFLPTNAFAQNTAIAQRPEQFEGQVLSIAEEQKDYEGTSQTVQKIELHVTSGRLNGQQITIEQQIVGEKRNYTVGDQVIVTVTKDLNGNDNYLISDYVRRTPLIMLFILFLIVVLVIARKRGLYSVIGMAISFAVLFFFLLPQISNGANPILIAILTSMLIIPLTFYSSHGFNKKTTAAVLGTIISLIITGILAIIFVEAAKISGFASEEAAFVKAAKGDLINIKGLLLAGIIIGVLGVLDDITISQANVVFQLKKAAEKMKMNDLYARAMEVGKDHIASMVNTLILVYTGAALPLLLLFIDNSTPFSEVINYEVVAEEIVRTLVASIGLVLAVPITTYITALFISQSKE